MVDVGIYLGLFVTAFGAASLLPLQSEALFVAALLTTSQPPWALLLVASLGNLLGSVLNWAIGRVLEQQRDRAWFPVDPKRLARARALYGRVGYWSLLLSWMPIVGDPLTLMAGVLREPLWRFLLLVGVAKTGRYLMLMAVTLRLGE